MSASPAKRALIAVANGTEEVEMATCYDILQRAGLAITLASVHGAVDCTLAHGMRVTADTTFGALDAGEAFDVVVLPGGMPGAEHLRDCGELEARVREGIKGGVPLVGAICAAPAVCLGGWGVIEGRRVTGYPAEVFEKACGEGFVREKVVVSEDRRVVTSRGPGTAGVFALRLVEEVVGKEMAKKLASEMLYA